MGRIGLFVLCSGALLLPRAGATITVFTSEAAFVTAVGEHALQTFETLGPGPLGESATIGGLTFSSPGSGLAVFSGTHMHGAKNTTPGGAQYLLADSGVPAHHDDLKMGVAPGQGALIAWGAWFSDLEQGPIVVRVDTTPVVNQGVIGVSGAIQFFGFVAGGGQTFQSVTLSIPDVTYGIDDVRTVTTGCAYGAGCPGSGGFVPVLTAAPCVVADGGTLTLAVSGALGSSTAFFCFGLTTAEIPLAASGCTLNVLPVVPFWFSLPLGGTGPGAGGVAVAGPLPTGLSGGTFTTQAFIADAGASLGFTGTNGTRITIR